MKKVLLGVAASVLFATSAFAGFGGHGSGADGQSAKDAVQQAGKDARREALDNGSSPTDARRAGDAARSEAEAARNDSDRDAKNGELGVYLNDN